MIFKKVYGAGIAFLLSLSLMVTPDAISAHSSTCESGGESFGWILNCTNEYGHAGTDNATYRFEVDGNGKVSR